MLGLLRDDISGIHILNVKVIYIKCPSNIILLTLPFKLTSVFMNKKMRFGLIPNLIYVYCLFINRQS